MIHQICNPPLRTEVTVVSCLQENQTLERTLQLLIKRRPEQWTTTLTEAKFITVSSISCIQNH